MENKTYQNIPSISDTEFYQYWQTNLYAEHATADKENLMAHFDPILQILPLMVSSIYYWQIFENDLPIPAIVLAGGDIAELTPYSTMNKLLDADPGEFLKTFHPDDLESVLSFITKFFSILYALPVPERKYLQATVYARVKNSRGDWVWSSLQYPSLLFDKEGKLQLGMALYTHMQHLLAQRLTPLLTILDTREGKHHFFCYTSENCKRNTSKLPSLTVREREILQLLSIGKASKEIASMLGISKNTVDNHRQRMLKKFNSVSSPELVSKAIGLV